jgi:predicted branched-subunit amino acid permease
MDTTLTRRGTRTLGVEARRAVVGRRSTAWDPDVRDGVGAMLPVVAAYLPLALMVGAAVAASGNPLAAWLSTWTIYGGAAHLVTLDVVAQGSGWVAAAVAGLLLQTRLSAYSTAMTPEWRTAPLAHRLLAGLVLVDAPWALARSRETGRRRFYFGAGLTLFVAWPVMVTIGALSEDVVTGVPVTALVPALAIGCTVIGQIRHRPVLVAAAAAGVAALVTASLSAGVALISAAVAGTVAAVLADGVVVRRVPRAEVAS